VKTSQAIEEVAEINRPDAEDANHRYIKRLKIKLVECIVIEQTPNQEVNHHPCPRHLIV
jgi:hypothetical protein